MILVLKDSAQIAQAREQLRVAGLDTSRGWRRAMYSLRWRVRFRCAAEPVAVNKSWDVWNMYQAATAYAPDRSARVFEMGSYNSEIPLVLWRAGYRSIRASDFNPLGRAIRWYGNRIDFRCEDFYNPDLPPASVGIMTALSVIEHGYDQAKLVATASRLLAPGGILLLSTDYREDGAHVPDDFRAFGLSYRIFSRADVESLVRDAAAAGLELISAPEWGPSDYPITWERWRFTFLFAGFRKIR
jgi:SAM-dependent methyltransferase